MLIMRAEAINIPRFVHHSFSTQGMALGRLLPIVTGPSSFLFDFQATHDGLANRAISHLTVLNCDTWDDPNDHLNQQLQEIAFTCIMDPTSETGPRYGA